MKANTVTLLQDELFKRVEESVENYQKRFHDDKTRFGMGVSINIASQMANVSGASFGLLHVIDPATKTAMGALKNSEAPDFATKCRESA